MKTLKEEHRPADLWFWDNWFASHDVKLCSLAAQGLWTNMLGIMRAGAIKGTLTVNGVPLGSKELAKIVGVLNVEEIERLLVELEYYQVFSRLENGIIINRRMYRESAIRQARAEAGKRGGLSKQKAKQNTSKENENVPSKSVAPLGMDMDISSLNIRKGVPDFDAFWNLYPRKVAKKVAAKAYAAIVKAGADPADLLKATEGYVGELKRNGTEPHYVLYPSTFLHEERWKDYLNIERPRQVGESAKPDHSPAYWAEYLKLKAQGLTGQALTDALAKAGLK